jgi:hypothetical protein
MYLSFPFSKDSMVEVIVTNATAYFGQKVLLWLLLLVWLLTLLWLLVLMLCGGGIAANCKCDLIYKIHGNKHGHTFSLAKLKLRYSTNRPGLT